MELMTEPVVAAGTVCLSWQLFLSLIFFLSDLFLILNDNDDGGCDAGSGGDDGGCDAGNDGDDGGCDDAGDDGGCDAGSGGVCLQCYFNNYQIVVL